MRRPHLPTVALALTLLLAAAASSFAQQRGTSAPQLITPRNQNSGGDTLELPTTPRQTDNIPPNLRPLQPQQGQELEIPALQLRRQAGYGQVTVTVTDQQGNYVTGLNKDDFKVYEDGQQRPIEFFRRDLRAPVSIGILVDTSGSMHPKIEQARRAIAQFLDDLNEKDDVFLFAFSEKPFLLQDFTTDHAQVRERLRLLHAYGRTALFEVILDGLNMVSTRGRYDKKALLVVTDGMDTASNATVEQVVREARRRGVLVYSIGIGDPGSSGSFSFSFGPIPLLGGDQDRVDAETLKTLSTETGAKTYVIREAGDGEALRTATTSISNELREQYTVGYLSPDPERGGYRRLRVDVPTHPDADVRVRKGVTVGGRTESASADPSGATP